MYLVRHIPNLLTISRLLLCPLVVLSHLEGKYLLGLGLFAAAAATDFLDGFLARRLGVVSRLGTILDPISDKILLLSFFSLLMSLGSCPPWFLALFLSTLILQGIGWLLLRTPRRQVPAPLRVGKWNTALQFFWIGVLFSDIVLRTHFPRNFHYSEAFHLLGYSFIAVLQVFVFFRYFLHYRAALLPDFRLLISQH